VKYNPPKTRYSCDTRYHVPQTIQYW